MHRKLSEVLLFCGVASFFVALEASAQAIYVIVPGNRPAPIASIANGTLVRVYVEEDSSYCCQITVALNQNAVFFQYLESFNNSLRRHSYGYRDFSRSRRPAVARWTKPALFHRAGRLD